MLAEVRSATTLTLAAGTILLAARRAAAALALAPYDCTTATALASAP
jgi:hypothetical protein